MVILHVISRLNFGGTAKYLVTLHSELKKAGVRSVIAAGQVQFGEVEDPEVEKLNYIKINHLGRRISLTDDFIARSEVFSIISEISPTIIHTHTFKAGFLVRIQRKRIERALGSKVRFFHTFHGHLFNDPEFQGLAKSVIKLIEKFLGNRTDQIITVGEKVKIDLEKMRIRGKEVTISIPPAVSKLKLGSKNLALKKFEVKELSRTRVLWLARMTGVKNPYKVVALAKLLPEIDFYMAGGGDLLEKISELATDNLKVLGWQDTRLILPIADIFLSTSENEGMPIALIEAQLASLPVVATDVGSVSEVILHNKSGFVCDKSEIELVHAIRKLAKSRKLRIKFGEFGRVHAINAFSRDRLISEHLKLYLH